MTAMRFKGLASAVVQFKGECICQKCKVTALSSTTQRVTIDKVPLEELQIEIGRKVRNTFVQPPIGWSVNGANNFLCDKCMEGKANG
jgi:hypothetical protein